jgi:hypothetical protein
MCDESIVGGGNGKPVGTTVSEETYHAEGKTGGDASSKISQLERVFVSASYVKSPQTYPGGENLGDWAAKCTSCRYHVTGPAFPMPDSAIPKAIINRGRIDPPFLMVHSYLFE